MSLFLVCRPILYLVPFRKDGVELLYSVCAGDGMHAVSFVAGNIYICIIRIKAVPAQGACSYGNPCRFQRDTYDKHDRKTPTYAKDDTKKRLTKKTRGIAVPTPAKQKRFIQRFHSAHATRDTLHGSRPELDGYCLLCPGNLPLSTSFSVCASGARTKRDRKGDEKNHRYTYIHIVCLLTY